MDYPLAVPGYEQIPLVVRTSVWKGPVILHDGMPLEKVKGLRGLNYRLVLEDGSELPLQIKMAGGGFVPQVIHNGQVIQVAPPLPVYAQALIYAPLVLIPLGGAIGGLCGGLAAAINVAIFRGERSTAVKVSLSLLVMAGAFITWLVAVAIIYEALHHHRRAS